MSQNNSHKLITLASFYRKKGLPYKAIMLLLACRMLEHLPKKKRQGEISSGENLIIKDIVKVKMTLNLVYKDEFDQRLV